MMILREMHGMAVVLLAWQNHSHHTLMIKRQLSNTLSMEREACSPLKE